MRSYLELMKEIYVHGIDKKNRTGIHTRSLFGRMLQFDLGVGFPLLTTKRVYWKAVAVELLWFLRNASRVFY